MLWYPDALVESYSTNPIDKKKPQILDSGKPTIKNIYQSLLNARASCLSISLNPLDNLNDVLEELVFFGQTAHFLNDSFRRI